jgi:hypothetical protein
MTKKTKTYMIVGGVAVAALAVGGIAYARMKAVAPPVPAGQLPAGTPATTFTAGTKYTFAAVLPAGATDQATLVTMLHTAGWQTPAVIFFGPTNTGTIPTGLEANTSGYVATGIWQGPATPVPAGVIAVVSPT